MDKWANDAIYPKDGSKLISISKSFISLKNCFSLQSVAIPKNTVVADNAFPETTTIIRK